MTHTVRRNVTIRLITEWNSLQNRFLLTFHIISGLLAAGGMGLWHGVEYYEKEKVVGEEFYQQWSNVS